MGRRLSAYTGCLLGLAAGDGLGQGPERLNGFLPASGYTQMAAYGCNGLLLGMTRGQMTGAMAPPVGYIAMALQEWADRQTVRSAAVRCWISRSDRLDYRRCPEPEVLDVLLGGKMGTMEDHGSALNGPGALMTAVAVGLFFDPERLPRREIQRLGAEAASLTHGAPSAFLSGAAMAHIVSRIVWDGESDFAKLSGEAGAMLRRRFGREYHQVQEICALFKKMRTLARWRKPGREEALRQIGGETAAQVLAGALYCCITAPGDTESAVERAALWSPAGAAVTGALLGAARGEEALPELWLEELECEGILRELAEDLHRGCPMMKGSKVFDIEWDAKYDSADL